MLFVCATQHPGARDCPHSTQKLTSKLTSCLVDLDKDLQKVHNYKERSSIICIQSVTLAIKTGKQNYETTLYYKFELSRHCSLLRYTKLPSLYKCRCPTFNEKNGLLFRLLFLNMKICLLVLCSSVNKAVVE